MKQIEWRKGTGSGAGREGPEGFDEGLVESLLSTVELAEDGYCTNAMWESIQRQVAEIRAEREKLRRRSLRLRGIAREEEN